MIDNIIFAIKLILSIMGIFLICYSTSSDKKTNKYLEMGVISLTFAFFMSGMGLVTNSNHPWQFLVLNGTINDWRKAFLGGCLFLSIPIIIYIPVLNCFKECS